MSAKDGISIAGSAGFLPGDAPIWGGGRRSLLSWAGYAGMWTALASSALFFGASTVLERYQAQPRVSIELRDWCWLASLNVHFDNPAVVSDPASVSQIGIPTPIALPVAPQIIVKRAPGTVATRQHPHQRKILQALARIKAEPVEMDVIAQRAALPVLTEAAKMQSLRMVLRGQFFAALDNQVPPTLVAAVPTVITQPAIQKVVHPKRRKTHKKVDTQIAGLQSLPPESIAPTAPFRGIPSNRPAAELVHEQQQLLTSLTTPAATVAAGITVARVERVTASAPPANTDSLTQVAAAPVPALAADSAPAPTVSISLPPSSESGTLVAQAETAPAGYVTQFGYSSYPHITVTIPPTHGNGTANTQVGTQPTVATPPITHRTITNTLAQLPTTTYVEAFEWSSSVVPSQIDELTRERGGAPDEEMGWEVTRAENHWPSLWWKANSAPTYSIPLVSNNALFFLANLAQPSVKVQAGAGIVMGKVSAGWSVELSGRSERPVFLTMDNRPVSIGDMETDRYFAFLNVEPGSHLVYLMNRSGATGVIAIPVLSGTSTFADVTKIAKRNVSGHLYDAGSSHQSGLANAQVRVVGQQNAKALTDGFGEFHISDVSVISNFPLYLESDADQGATHRYRVAAGQERDLTLYRLRDEQIRELIDQLEGGVSPDSGLIVAAAPQLAQSTTEGLFPSVSSLLPAPTLRPETYTMSNAGQLEVNTALTADAVRFVSVQVPDGPAIAKLENKAQATVWSELVFAQARIVNVVGPY